MCGGTTSSRGWEGCSDVIDFKYHMVSLVAVFLALAVGIILGAGPLRGQLSEALESQVAELGEERNALRSRVDLQEQRADDKDELLSSLLPSAVAGTLTDRRVTIVELPGADTTLADAMATALQTAGAHVVARTTVARSWIDPEGAAERQGVADELLPTFGRTDGETSPAALLATVLAGPRETDESFAWAQADERLMDTDAIETQRLTDGETVLPGAPAVAPDVVVVLSGGLDAAALNADSSLESRLTERVAIVAALAEQNVPTVVIAGGSESYADPQTIAEDPLVAAIRSTVDVAEAVSSVDNIESAAGLVSATWATARMLEGDQGHYGLADDAQAPAPPEPVRQDVAADSTTS